MAAPTNAAPGGQVAAGGFFGLPGLVGWTEQKETNDQTVVQLSGASSVAANSLLPFKQTDVVFGWEFEFTLTNTFAIGAGTVAQSNYFPYTFLGQCQLQIQNMYPLWSIQNGYDAYLWDLIRPPMPSRAPYTNDQANPSQTFTDPNFFTAANNLDASTGVTNTTNPIMFTLQVPAGIWFDEYYDLTKDGTINSQRLRTMVSPVYMASTARNIQPNINFNPAFASSTDKAPWVIGTAGPTFTGGSMNLGFTRKGIYSQNNPAVLPLVYNWQYLRIASNRSLAGLSVADIPIPTYGQILSIYVRMFDPLAQTGTVAGSGAPIAITNVTKCQVQYGSSLLRYDDTPRRMQRRFMQQHEFMPPPGVLIWDFATDQYGRTTNAQALNTLTTAGVEVHLEFSAALSAAAYAVIGVEALTYVE